MINKHVQRYNEVDSHISTDILVPTHWNRGVVWQVALLQIMANLTRTPIGTPPNAISHKILITTLEILYLADIHFYPNLI